MHSCHWGGEIQDPCSHVSCYVHTSNINHSPVHCARPCYLRNLHRHSSTRCTPVPPRMHWSNRGVTHINTTKKATQPSQTPLHQSLPQSWRGWKEKKACSSSTYGHDIDHKTPTSCRCMWPGRVEHLLTPPSRRYAVSHSLLNDMMDTCPEAPVHMPVC